MRSIKDQGLRKIGEGHEQRLEQARTHYPHAPLFAVIEHHREWSDLRDRWLIVSEIVTGDSLIDVASKYDKAHGVERMALVSAAADVSPHTGYDRTIGFGWSVKTEYAGGKFSGFIVGLASPEVLSKNATGRYVDRKGNDIFLTLMGELYPDAKTE